MKYEDILHQIGAFGKYQMLLVFAMGLMHIQAAFHFIATVFLAAKTDHWCVVPTGTINCSQLQVHSLAECQEAQKQYGIPYELDTNGKKVYSSCERYVLDDEYSGGNHTLKSTDVIPCDAGWDFDHSHYKSTINEEFDLVCDRKDLPGIAQSVWFAGLMSGSVVWGLLGDWIGRRKSFILSLCLVSISSIVTTFVPTFAAFTALRFITASCGYGTLMLTFVIATEIVGPKRRVTVGVVLLNLFSIGYILLSILAFLLREWRHLQLAISLPYILTFFLVIVLPESPRWLISKGRFEEAAKIIQTMAKVNGKEAPDNLPDNLRQSLQENTWCSWFLAPYLDLIRTPNIRKKSLIMFFDWFTVTLAYYGLSLSTSALVIDNYVAAFVSGAVEIPSTFFCWFVMERYGRPLTLAGFFVSGGLFCLITIFIPIDAARAAVAMLGKFSITAAFGHLYIFSVELFPTVIRSKGVGACSLAARISSILAPLILILAKYWGPLPLCVFGGCSVLAGILSLMLPETLGCILPDTIEDGENFGKGQGFRLCYKADPHSDNGDSAPPPADYLPLSTRTATGENTPADELKNTPAEPLTI